MEQKRKIRYIIVFLLLGGCVVLLCVSNICIGSVSIPVFDILASIQGKTVENARILWDIRMPRMLAALILGGALGLAGYLLQTFFHNPIAGPFVLGISSGAKMTVSVVMVFLMGQAISVSSGMMIVAAFVGAMISMGFVLLVSRKVDSMAMLVVAGVMIGYICSAITELVVTFADDAQIVNLHNWSRGSFSGTTWDNVTVINEDILKVDIAALAQEKNGGKPIKVVANLPYYITTPIIMGLFENHVPISSITIMVQKEVADRMQVGPGTKDYGALSLAVQYYAKPQIIANVPPNCFMPRPKVGSAVIQLVRYEEPPVQVENEKLMFRLIRASFNQRRKTLVNGLKNSQELDFSKEEIEKAMAETGIPVNVRGEALTLAEFADLANVFNKLR